MTIPVNNGALLLLLVLIAQVPIIFENCQIKNNKIKN